MNQQQRAELEQIRRGIEQMIERATRRWAKAKGKERRELGQWIADAEVQLAEIERELDQ